MSCSQDAGSKSATPHAEHVPPASPVPESPVVPKDEMDSGNLRWMWRGWVAGLGLRPRVGGAPALARRGESRRDLAIHAAVVHEAAVRPTHLDVLGAAHATGGGGH